jgi:hypothetical protein
MPWTCGGYFSIVLRAIQIEMRTAIDTRAIVSRLTGNDAQELLGEIGESHRRFSA